MTLNALRQAITFIQPGNDTLRHTLQQTGKCLVGLSGSLTLAVWGVLSLPSQAQIGSPSQLGVEINGLRNQDGQICLSLFANSQGFPSDGNQAVQNQCVTASDLEPIVTFTNVQPGSYAIAVLHDANSDSIINRNVLGIPSEGFGFSGNPVIRTGPPTFGDAMVFVAGNQTTIQIDLNYF